MPKKKESVFINNQSLNVNETARSSVLKPIKGSKNLQEAIEQLEKENLIWYLIDPLHKDEEVGKQINSKWEEHFQQFGQSINATHEELKLSLPNQSFLVYSMKDNGLLSKLLEVEQDGRFKIVRYKEIEELSEEKF